MSDEPIATLRTTFWQRYVYAARFNWQRRPRLASCREIARAVGEQICEIIRASLVLVCGILGFLTAPVWWPLWVLYRVVWRAARVAHYHAIALDQKMHDEQERKPNPPDKF